MNKNCLHCLKLFEATSTGRPPKKFCGKHCYMQYVKKNKNKNEVLRMIPERHNIKPQEVKEEILENKKVDSLIDRFFKVIKGK